MMTETRALNTDLDAIKERVSQATEGPWQAEYEAHGGYDAMSSAFIVRDAQRTEVAVLDTDVSPSRDGYQQLEEEPRCNAAFIAQAREDVPVLIAKVEELRALLQPFLDNPTGGQEECHHCMFCYAEEHWSPAQMTARRHDLAILGTWKIHHRPECPVLHKDELLGRVCKAGSTGFEPVRV